MSVNEAALIELIDLARRRGGISMEDLREALPIDSMTVEDISHVLARLDEAGFDLDIDPELLSPQKKMVPKDGVPVAKRDQTRLPETAPERAEQQKELSGSSRRVNPENRVKRLSDPTASVPMLPWILAFAIVVFAVFAAFAF
jgi:hypothetical protein